MANMLYRHIALLSFQIFDTIYLERLQMGLSKEIYSVSVSTITLVLKALSHGARLMILQYISEHECATNKELVDAIEYLSQSTVSGHIKQLKEIKLIIATQRDTCMIYTLNEPLWDEIKLLAKGFADGDYSLSDQI